MSNLFFTIKHLLLWWLLIAFTNRILIFIQAPDYMFKLALAIFIIHLIEKGLKTFEKY